MAIVTTQLAESSARSSARYSALEMELEEMNDKFDASTAEAENLLETLDKYQRELEEARSLKNDLPSQAHELQSQISTLGNTNEQQSELSELKEECARLVFDKGRSLEKEHDRSAMLEHQVSGYKKECARLTFECVETKESLEKFQRELDDSRSLNNNLTEHVKKLQFKIGILEIANQAPMDEVEDSDDDTKSISMEQLHRSSSELLDSRFRSMDLSSEVEELQKKVSELQGVNQNLVDQLQYMEGDHTEDLLPRLRVELFDAASRESYLNKELTQTKSSLQQDRHLLSSLSTELYDSTSRESQLRGELAVCYKRLELISNQVGIVQK
jgi:chromosome segregation ATPase